MIGASYITAGRATFTVSNGRGEHYTYRVSKSKTAHARFGHTYFVSVLTGPNNEADYTYLCILDSARFAMVRTVKTPDALFTTKPGLVLAFALQCIIGTRALPAGYAIDHCGHCGRCGRTLTVPESIESGIGPECARIMGRVAA